MPTPEQLIEMYRMIPPSSENPDFGEIVIEMSSVEDIIAEYEPGDTTQFMWSMRFADDRELTTYNNTIAIVWPDENERNLRNKVYIRLFEGQQAVFLATLMEALQIYTMVKLGVQTPEEIPS